MRWLIQTYKVSGKKPQFSLPSPNEPCHVMSVVNLTGLLLSNPNSYRKARAPGKALFRHTALSLAARVWHNAFALTSTASSSNVHRSHMGPAQLRATANLTHRSAPTSASGFSAPTATPLGNHATFQVFFRTKQNKKAITQHPCWKESRNNVLLRALVTALCLQRSGPERVKGVTGTQPQIGRGEMMWAEQSYSLKIQAVQKMPQLSFFAQLLPHPVPAGCTLSPCTASVQLLNMQLLVICGGGVAGGERPFPTEEFGLCSQPAWNCWG